MNPIDFRSNLEAAKERLRIPELWRILNLPGDPPTRDGVKFASPLRPDPKPSCSFYEDCRRMMDWSQGKSYDGADLLGEALGLKNGEACHRFIEIANGSPITVHPARLAEPKPKPQTERRPVLSGFVKGGRDELQRIADSRKIDVRAVELAQDLGTLKVGEVCGYRSWILFDESGICAEARRLNRKPYPPIINSEGKVCFDERKAHTIRGSKKNWPVGILPAKDYRQSIEAFLLVEGGPDYLAALHFALAQKRIGVLPVAMLGRGQGIGHTGLHPDSLQYFRGQRVRIVPHNDPDGGSYRTAIRWAKQLRAAGAEADFFDLKELTAPVKDLNDCCELAASQAAELIGLFP